MGSITDSPHQILSLTSMLISLILFSYSLPQLSQAQQIGTNEGGGAQRRLLGFKEKLGGTNSTFDCSPSGPCVLCQYSEKSDDKYRCSETGYRIPFKCVKIGAVSKEASGKGTQNSRSTPGGSSTNTNNHAVKHRRLADSDSRQEVEPLQYVTYRSCIQGVDEEKLSVMGFEVLMLGLLLVTGSFVIFRRKKTLATAGVGGVRVQSNSRF